jgi:hypothetical protein
LHASEATAFKEVGILFIELSKKDIRDFRLIGLSKLNKLQPNLA